MAADEQGDHERDAQDKLERGPEHGHQAGEQQGTANVFAVGGLEGVDLGLFLRKGTDEPGPGEIFFGLGGDVREHGLDAFKAGVDAGTEVLDQDGGQGQREKGKEGKPGAHAQHERKCGGGEDDRVGRVHDGRPEQLADGGKVIGGPRHDVAGAVALEESGGLAFEVGEEVVAEVELDLAGGADDDLPSEVEADRGKDGDTEDGERVLPDGGRVDVAPHVVNRAADEQGNGGLGAVIDDERQPAPGEASPVTAKVGKERTEALEHRFGGVRCCGLERTLGRLLGGRGCCRGRS